MGQCSAYALRQQRSLKNKIYACRNLAFLGLLSAYLVAGSIWVKGEHV